MISLEARECGAMACVYIILSINKNHTNAPLHHRRSHLRQLATVRLPPAQKQEVKHVDGVPCPPAGHLQLEDTGQL